MVMRLILAGVIAFGVLWPDAARTATLERLVMPGPVIEAHADVEDTCESCHASFDSSKQDALCLACHEPVADDLDRGTGYHGRAAAAVPCKRCHAEHLGRAADIVGLNEDLFDHSQTDFVLDGAHASVSCVGCHDPADVHRAAPGRCVECHGEDDPHRGSLGPDCAGCHDTAGWPVAAFDHSQTAFVLRGAHQEVTCAACHPDDRFSGAPSRCAACHGKDDVHQGRRGDDCGSCHAEDAWTGATFDHRASTGFALEGAHASLACASCHLADMEVPEPPTDCNGCHGANDPHQGRNGADCAACHDQSTWDSTRFDHGIETGFVLSGAHAGLACSGCHRGKLTDPVDTECRGCHADDDPHAGTYPACGGCHEPSGWWDVAFNHDFTTFPLVGRHKLVACEACHVDPTFRGAPEACIDCHRDADRHDGVFSPHCQRCHNPNGWVRWQFDHGQDTTFALDGRHADLECEACHRSNVWDAPTSTSCARCHVADDPHEGRFGSDCAECHTTVGFDDIRPFRR